MPPSTVEQSLSLLRATLESSADGILSVGRDGRILVFNRRFAEMWSIPDGVLSEGDDNKALDVALGQLVDPETFLARVRALYDDPEALSYDQIALRDGRIFERYSTPQVVDGEVVARAWYFRDISERRRQEEQVRSMALFAEMSPNVVLRLDPQGRVLLANPTASSILKLDGRVATLSDLLPGRPPLDLARLITEGAEQRWMEEIEGRWYQVLLQGVPDLGVAQLFGADVSDHVRTEQALAQKTGELERSNADLAQFAYAASHDLQEPLRIVASYLQLLERASAGRLDEKGREFLGYALDGANRMRALIQDLLQYARAGAAGVHLPTDCNVSCDRALRNLRTAIEETGATVTRDELPIVSAVGAEMDLVMQNLIGNAIKFHGTEPPRVHVAAERANGLWRVCVTDNGIGIRQQDFQRVFQLFQRLHGRDEYPGTGIGLAIVKKIVERHGGQVSVTSEPGRGSTFCFTLPGVEATSAG